MGVDSDRASLVLIVDDDEDIRETVQLALQLDNHTTALAAHGGEALDWLRQHRRPCLILLDLMMPVMDGWDFRAEQLADPDLKDVPVFILTAVGFSADTVRAQFGNIPFVPKPPAHEGLLEMVRRVCLAPKPGQAAEGP